VGSDIVKRLSTSVGCPTFGVYIQRRASGGTESSLQAADRQIEPNMESIEQQQHGRSSSYMCSWAGAVTDWLTGHMSDSLIRLTRRGQASSIKHGLYPAWMAYSMMADY
jgi:hypothetical protein